MKKHITIIISALALSLQSCSDFLDIKPLDRIPEEQAYKDISSLKAVLATLYNKMPIEDFNYNPKKGFNYWPESNGWVDPGYSTSCYTDESTKSEGSGVEIKTEYWGYGAIRQINQFIESVSKVSMSEEQLNQLLSEAYFIRAYVYFALAKRYGGVPIITEVQQMDDGDKLYVPRSTEKDTWDFILTELDNAIKYLPKSYTSVEGSRRATVWAAYALKSRVALFAASVAKYWNNAPLIGEAVTLKLVGGFTQEDINRYYDECIKASEEIILNSGKKLYKPNPATPEEAAKNYQKIFEEPTNSEVMNEIIFAKGYIDGSQTKKQGHNTDIFFNPCQTNTGYYRYGRFSPTLEMVEAYEYYDNPDGTLITTTDDNEDYSVSNPSVGIDVDGINFKKYDNLTDIFKGKDARLYASIILPGSTWKGVEIIMQGGFIKPNGQQSIYKDDKIEVGGKTYYSYGAEKKTDYSGFASFGVADNANYSITGFSLKKFLQEGKNVNGTLYSSTTDFIDMRLSEVYLNYAEAVVESGLGDDVLAKKCLNDIRFRAAHTREAELTLENVLRERRVELAFEGQRYWDLIRRREAHLVFDGSTIRKALVPILDLRGGSPKYIFVRANSFYDDLENGRKFNERTYYLSIPGIASNGLVQNPQY